jgi:hypothetical protein
MAIPHYTWLKSIWAVGLVIAVWPLIYISALNIDNLPDDVYGAFIERVHQYSGAPAPDGSLIPGAIAPDSALYAIAQASHATDHGPLAHADGTGAGAAGVGGGVGTTGGTVADMSGAADARHLQGGADPHPLLGEPRAEGH